MSEATLPTPKALLARVEQFLTSKQMSAPKFGKAALGDPRFVYQLREGRDLRASTISEVLAYLKDPEKHQVARGRRTAEKRRKKARAA